MGILFALIGALIVGALARLLFPGKVELGLLATTGLGLAGGIIGKSIAWALGFVGGTITAVLGAIILIAIVRKLRA